jgi:hypothetical protein
VQVFLLKNKKYVAEVVYEANNEAAPVHILDGCVINIKNIFSEI